MLSKLSNSLVLPLCIGLFLGVYLTLNIQDSYKAAVNLNNFKKIHSVKLWNRTLADKLYSEVKVLCWIMTNPDNHKTRAYHVKNTWGKRCNKLIFMSSKVDDEIGAVALPVFEGRENLWDKTKAAFQYVYRNHPDYDYFLKADDDS